MFFLARVVCRKPWLGALVYIAAVSVSLVSLVASEEWIELAVLITVHSVTVLVMLRYGLLALAVWATFGWFIEHSLLTYEFGTWYGESSLVAVVAIAAAALWAFWTSLGGRPMLPASWSVREA
jgi:hypothetical protein